MECQVLSLRRSPRSKHRHLQVEQLEQRWCPDGTKGGAVLIFNVVSMNDPSATIAGQVIGPNNQNAVVQFSGAISQTVTTNANGSFSFTVNANYLGTITGVAWDNLGRMTDPVEQQLGSAPPEIASFTASQGSNNLWTFSGHVDSECLSGNRVSFQGLAAFQGHDVYTNANGDFSLTLWLPSAPSGTISATAYDCWGLTDVAYTSI